VAVLISGEGRAGQRPVAGRVTAGVAGPGWPHIATRIIIGPVRGRRARAGRGVGQCTKPPGLGSGCGRGVTRGPHGLLPNEEGPRPATPQGRSWGTYGRTGNTTTVPAPRAGSGARGRRDRSGLTRRAATRADARIQNPSGTRQPGTNPSCNAELRVAPGPDCDAGPGHIFPLGSPSYNGKMEHDRGRRRKPERCAWNYTAPTTLGAYERSNGEIKGGRNSSPKGSDRNAA